MTASRYASVRRSSCRSRLSWPWRSCARRACSSCGSQPPPCARARAWATCSGWVSRSHKSCQTSASSWCAGA
jgi:hypothetical protein